MSNVVRFPGRKDTAAKPIPREKFERLAELSLDVVDLIVSILNDVDGDLDFEAVDPDREDGGDAEPSMGAPENHHTSQVVWLRGSDRDLEIDRQEPNP